MEDLEAGKQQPFNQSNSLSGERIPGFINILGRTRLVLTCCIILVMAVLAVRLLNAPQTVGVNHDASRYLVLAESFSKGQAFRRVNYPDAPLDTGYPYGYPLFVLSVPVFLFGINPTIIRLVNLMLLAGSAILGYRLLRFKYMKPIVLSATLLFVLNSRAIGFALEAMSDTAFTFFAVLWLLLFQLESANRKITGWYLLAIVILAVAILVRYWGVAFAGAAAIILLFERQHRKLLVLIVGLTLLLAPLFIFLAVQQTEAPASSYFAVQMITKNIDHYLQNIQVSLVTYSEAIPLVLIPLVGPRVLEILNSSGLNWLATLFNMVVVSLVVVGFVRNFARWCFIALSVALYFSMIFVLVNHYDKPVVFDEPRYLIPISLFLYAYFFDGMKVVLERVTSRDTGERLVYLAAAVLLLFMLWRNQQQTSVAFTVADLSTGGAWAQENTDQNAVFMTPDPPGRYLYLQRHTVEYPVATNTSEITAGLNRWAVTHLLQAPPLLLDGSANLEQLADPNINNTVEQLTRVYPECLTIVFEDPIERTTILEMDRTCIK
jgi:hypothetical protein